MEYPKYEDQWRYRITKIRVFLLDNSSNIIPNENGDYKVGLAFPTAFQDLDSSKYGHHFRGHEFFCRSYYLTSGTDKPEILEQCEIADEFTDIHNPPTPNGEYRIQIQVNHKKESLAYEQLIIVFSIE